MMEKKNRRCTCFQGGCLFSLPFLPLSACFVLSFSLKEQRSSGTEIKSQGTIITTEKEREKSTSSYVFDRVKQRCTSEEKNSMGE